MLAVIQLAFDGRFGGERFAGSLSPMEHYLWKLEGPPGRPSRATITEVDSRIVGASLVLRRLHLIEGVERTVREAVDGAVHPDFQGRGIRSARQRFMREDDGDHDMRLSLKDHPAEFHIGRREGQLQFANQIRILTRTNHPWWLAKQSRSGRGARLLVPLRAGRTAILTATAGMRRGRSSVHDISWEIVTTPRFDGRTDDLFDDAASEFDFIQVRHHDYLNWRFCDPRAGQFVVRVAEQDGVMLGYAVLTSGGGRGNIADLLARPGRGDVVESLVRDATERFDAAGVKATHCWMVKHHPYKDALRRSGFITSRRDLTFTYQHLRLSPDDLSFLQNPSARIHMMQGDTDGI